MKDIRVQSLTTEALDSVGEDINSEEIVGVVVGSTITYDPKKPSILLL